MFHRLLGLLAKAAGNGVMLFIVDTLLCVRPDIRQMVVFEDQCEDSTMKYHEGILRLPGRL